MEGHSSATYRESSQKTKSSANGKNDADGVSLKPTVEVETYNKVHHDLDVAAAHRKPIVTESKYKVNVAEPGVDSLPLADHDHVEGRVDKKSEKSSKSSYNSHTTSASEKPKAKPTGESQKGQFIAKPDVYSEKGRGAPKEEKDGGFAWVPVLGGAAAIAAAIAGLMFYKKRNPDADQKFKRLVEDGDHRVKGIIGSGEHRVKELIGSGQQKFRNLVGRGDHSDSDDEGHSHSHSHSHNPLNVFDGGLYQVKQGDNLTKIARKSGKKSWHDIADKNPSIRNPDLIYPGDRLKL